MLLFIMLDPFYVGKGCPSCVSKNPVCCPNAPPRWGALGHLFPTHQTVNIYRSMQDPQALESLKCRYYIVVQTGILAKLLTHNRNMQ